jgi:hypothetical protein
MEKKQSISLNADFLDGFSSVFMKLVFVIIAVYIFIMVLNFLRDIFINKETKTKSDDIIDLLTILNKLFFVSGFGFVIGNIIQSLFTHISEDSGGVSMPSMAFRGEWEYLSIGIILIFAGMGFKVGKKILKRERME